MFSLSLAKVVLIAASFLLSSMVGIGIYQHSVVEETDERAACRQALFGGSDLS
jgi:hypothetical protein